MGCDLSCIVETLLEDKWVGIGECTGRNYIAFAQMANVRNETGLTDVHAPRGIPADASKWARFQIATEEAIGMGGGHSHSWLSAREMFPIAEALHERLKDRVRRLDSSVKYHARALDQLYGTWLSNYLVIRTFHAWRFNSNNPDKTPHTLLLSLDRIRFVFYFRG